MGSDAKPILAVLAGVAVLVVGLLALRPGTVEIQHLPPVTLGDPQDVGPSGTSAGVVIAKNQSGGTSLLGLRFGRTTYRVRVQFYAPPGCFGLVEFGDQWPAPFAECSSDIPVAGEVTGLGNAPTGESIIGVDVEVTEACFAEVATGTSWPPNVLACTVPDS